MNNLPDYVRRAIRTFITTFLGVFAVALFGWFHAIQEWSTCAGDTCQFPSANPLGKAAIAAVAAAAAAVLTLVQNWLEDNTKFPALLKAPPSQGVNPQP